MNDHVENARKVEHVVESRLSVCKACELELERAGDCPMLRPSFLVDPFQGRTTISAVRLIRKSSITSITLPIVPGEATRRTIRAGDSGKQLYEGVLCRNGYRKKKKGLASYTRELSTGRMIYRPKSERRKRGLTARTMSEVRVAEADVG